MCDLMVSDGTDVDTFTFLLRAPDAYIQERYDAKVESRPQEEDVILPSAQTQTLWAVLENRPDSLYGVTPQVGWLSGLGVEKGQLSCCDDVKGTLFSAVAVDHVFGHQQCTPAG